MKWENEGNKENNLFQVRTNWIAINALRKTRMVSSVRDLASALAKAWSLTSSFSAKLIVALIAVFASLSLFLTNSAPRIGCNKLVRMSLQAIGGKCYALKSKNTYFWFVPDRLPPEAVWATCLPFLVSLLLTDSNEGHFNRRQVRTRLTHRDGRGTFLPLPNCASSASDPFH